MTIALIPTGAIGNEVITVAAGAATLAAVPNIDSLIIPGFTKVYTTPSKGQYQPTAGSAVLAFSTADNGATPTANYFPVASPGVTVDKTNEIIVEVNVLSGSDPDLIITTKGDLIAGDAGGDAARLAVGANDLPLVADSGAALGVSYKALPIAGGGTGEVTQTAAMDALSPTSSKGDLLVDNGTSVVAVPVGTDGQVLQADSGAASGVSWQTPAAGLQFATVELDFQPGGSPWTFVEGDGVAHIPKVIVNAFIQNRVGDGESGPSFSSPAVDLIPCYSAAMAAKAQAVGFGTIMCLGVAKEIVLSFPAPPLEAVGLPQSKRLFVAYLY